MTSAQRAVASPRGTVTPRPRPRIATNSLDQTARRIDNRASGMAAQLEAWLIAYAVSAANDAVDGLKEFGARSPRAVDAIAANVLKVEVRKASKRELEAQLRRLLTRNGVNAMTGAMVRVAGTTATVPDVAMLEFLRTKEIKVQQIMGSLYESVQDSLRTILGDANMEVPRPSVGEIARRIRTQFHGDQRSAGQALALIPDPRATTVLPTSVAITPTGQLYAFSPERAALIARTEMVQAENTGIVAGYEELGAIELEWLSYQDGRSGDRRHDEMNGVRVAIGEQFELPDGTMMRYPGDPSAPIRHLANCRCTTRPIFDRRQKR